MISVFLRTIPTLILGILLFHISAPVSGLALALFFVSLVFSYLLVWLMASLIGLFAFWTMKLGNLGFLKNVILSILSGQLIPIWFFPKALQDVLRFLPFPYTYQAPVAIYIGKTQAPEALQIIAVQIIWVLLLFLLMCLVWSHARKRVMVQGG